MSAVIPASRFKRDGDTAWWAGNPAHLPFHLANMNRPCDTCRGTKVLGISWGEHMKDVPCPPCHGTGRHLFDIEVEQIAYGEEYTGEPVACGTTTRTLTVSVAPDMDMVLPIHKFGENYPVDHAHIEPSGGSHHYHWFRNERFRHDDPSSSPWVWDPVLMPDDAKPGDYAVKLLIHGADNKKESKS